MGAVAVACFCALLVLVVPGEGKYKEVDQNCRKKLTEKDPHMSAYIGHVYEVNGVHTTGERYRYELGVCTDVGSTPHYEGCGTMQFGLSNPNLTHCLGKLSMSQVARTPDGAWIELTYSGGSKYGSHCGQGYRTTRLLFACDPYISGRGSLDFLEENNGDSLCYYMFSIASRTVCGFPGNLTPGDIILIIVAAVVVIWLVVMVIGMIFKRFIVGAKGWEQIPFLDFYKAFGNLEADGCDLVCRTRSSRRIEYKEPTFGTDTDEEDEDKDDNLLPM